MKHYRLYPAILIWIYSFLSATVCFSVFPLWADARQQVRGFWVECEGSNDTLSSPQKLDELIRICKTTAANTIFLQVQRHNRSWYNSRLADTAPWDGIWKKYKIDPLKYTIAGAHERGIKVHAWLNMFRIGKDPRAPIIRKLGRDVITRDGRGVSLLKSPAGKLPDGGYWLDPGDLGVQEYLLGIVEEILNKYPTIDGIHLDFVRLPYRDLNPGSRFCNRKDFGYGKRSVERFQAQYGYSPLKMDLSDRNKTQRWDNWRREQITSFIEKVYKLCKKKNPRVQVSCAAQSVSDRAYLVAYQDWRTWLKEQIVDFVVVMNYSIDRKLVRYISDAAIKLQTEAGVYIGLGAYLMLTTPNVLYQQIMDCQKLNVPGIILFSYDAILKNKDILKSIARNHWWSK